MTLCRNPKFNPRILTRTPFPGHIDLGKAQPSWDMLSDLEAKFTVFPKLPKELRLKIWGYSLPGRRSIAVMTTIFEENGRVVKLKDSNGDSENVYSLYVREPSPAILFVNAESRAVALETYHPLLTKVKGGHEGGILYMNFDKDVLYLPHNCIQ